MKGIILAGGNGTRLRPLTLTTNKHLLPVYNKQMIFYPLQTLLDAGINDILIISGREYAGHFVELLGSGSQFDAKFTYKVQDKAGGIAEALGLAEAFIDNEPNFTVILGDNIYEDKLNFDISLSRYGDNKAKLFLKKSKDYKRFGVAIFDNDGDITRIIEKPSSLDSDEASVVTGAYVYPNSVFEVIKGLVPSARNELEITDVNNYYAQRRELDYDTLTGFWSDAGTFESLARASQWLAEKDTK